MMDYALGSTVYIQFTTRAFSTGVPTQLAGSPVLSVLEENNATPITAGVSVSVDRASVTGLNEATIVATSGNGYESGKSYALYISTGTVGGVSVVGEVVGRFSIEKSSALRPTTAGRTLDVTAGGNAGIDWANVETPGSTVSLSATTVSTVTTLTNLPAITSNWLTAAGIAASALNGKGDWNVGKTGYSLTATTGLGNQTANITGNLSGSVGSVTGAVGSVTGAVGSVTGAVGSVTGAVGSVTAGVTVTTNNDKTGYALSATGSAAMTEGYAALGAAPTLPQCLYEMRALLAEKSISGTTLTAKKLDGSTTAATYTLNDATSPTAITRAT